MAKPCQGRDEVAQIGTISSNGDEEIGGPKGAAYMVKEVGIKPSMGEVGNSYENAHAESFIKTIKNEEVWMNEYETLEDIHRNIKQFLEGVYNKKRLHSSIGYLSPNKFEQEALNKCMKIR